jgi:signal transduction histidine kinase
LALVRSFVEMHGGWVALSSEPGRGVIVTCHLPAEPPHDAPPAAPPPAPIEKKRRAAA